MALIKMTLFVAAIVLASIGSCFYFLAMFQKSTVFDNAYDNKETLLLKKLYRGHLEKRKLNISMIFVVFALILGIIWRLLPN